MSHYFCLKSAQWERKMTEAVRGKYSKKPNQLSGEGKQQRTMEEKETGFSILPATKMRLMGTEQ